MADEDMPDSARLKQIAQELVTIRKLLSDTANSSRDAESEVPEKMRRFTMYMHDIKDINNLYHELGLVPPTWVKHEMERCDDRFRQLLTEAHTDTGAFEKVRQQMAEDPENRYDHTRQLAAPKKET